MTELYHFAGERQGLKLECGTPTILRHGVCRVTGHGAERASSKDCTITTGRSRGPMTAIVYSPVTNDKSENLFMCSSVTRLDTIWMDTDLGSEYQLPGFGSPNSVCNCLSRNLRLLMPVTQDHSETSVM